MSKRLLTATQSAVRAADIFHTFRSGKPDLVDLGIPAIHQEIGGMFAGNLVGLAAGQNVGKSSMLLSMGTTSKDRIGIIECEDGPDVWGARLIAHATGIPPTRIRRKDLDQEEVVRIREALDRGIHGPEIVYASANVDAMRDAVVECLEAGCRCIALNYLQKFRGHNGSSRAAEVAETMGHFLQACQPNSTSPGAVPLLLSQLSRGSGTSEPYPSSMKESGDIEAECRLIIMGWRDTKDPLMVRWKVAKSSFGGGGLRFAYSYTDHETLEPCDDDSDFEGDF